MMQVETFECETVPNDECTDEARVLAESLGAKGQDAFYQKDRPVAAYRKMTPEEYAVYKLLFPHRESIDKFSAAPIPLRVLQVGAHAKELLEGTLIIWHQGVGKDDPILTLREGSEYSGTYYLLARWGNALEEFSVLRQQAVTKFAMQCKAALMKCRQEVDAALASVEITAQMAIAKGKTDEPGYHWYV
jgi:hypothetical protein